VDAPLSELAGPLPRPLADEVALLLASEGIAATLESRGGGTAVLVPGLEHARAARILAEEYPGGLAAAAAGGRAARAAPAGAAPERWFGRASWVLFALLAAWAAIFVAAERAGGTDSTAVLLRFGATRPAHVRAGESWRLVTALFVHIGPRHLLANATALLVLGPALAAALGAGRFALVYLLAGAAGNLVSNHFALGHVVSAGASGAILGVLGALGGQRLRFAASARYRGWQVIAALLAYLAIAVGAGPEVDTLAHLGGLAAGVALGLVVPPLPPAPSTSDRLVSLACGAAAAALTGWSFWALVRAR
jgi:rhomboid protease GluP